MRVSEEIRRGPRPAGIANEVNNQIALEDEVSQLVEQGEAALFEVLLNLDFVRLALERAKLVRQFEAI